MRCKFIEFSIRKCIVLFACSALTACDAGRTDNSDNSLASMSVRLPQTLRQIQSIDLNQVIVTVRLAGNGIPVRGSNGNWIISVNRLDYTGVSTLTVEYSLQLSGSSQLVTLATYSGSVTMTESASIDPVGSFIYSYDSDGDGYTNFAELSNIPSSDPTNASNTPASVAGSNDSETVGATNCPFLRGGSNDLSAIAGLYDASSAEGDDISYFEIKSNGEIVDYDYEQDNFGSGENCYSISAGEGTVEATVRDEYTYVSYIDPELDCTILSQRVFMTRTASGLSWSRFDVSDDDEDGDTAELIASEHPFVTGISTSDLNSCN